MGTVALVGTLDTKGHEYAFVAGRLRDLGLEVLVIDCGILGPPLLRPDIERTEVAAAAGEDVAELAAAGDRGAAVQAMSRGAGNRLRITGVFVRPGLAPCRQVLRRPDVGVATTDARSSGCRDASGKVYPW